MMSKKAHNQRIAERLEQIRTLAAEIVNESEGEELRTSAAEKPEEKGEDENG